MDLASQFKFREMRLFQSRGSNYLGNNILMSEMFLPFWLTEPLTAAQHQKMEDSAMFSTNGMPSRELYDAYPRYEPDAR